MKSLKFLFSKIREIYVFPKNLLRYFNLININYKLDGKINFGSSKANLYFLNKLKSCNSYFEYGSGNSTLMAHKLKKRYMSAESDKNFSLYLKKNYKLNILEKNFGLVKFYSWPLFEKFRRKELRVKSLKYAKSITIFSKRYGFPDLILIDGRCRVLCALTIYKELRNIKKKILVIVDDFKNRKHYLVIKKFFFIKKVGRLAVLTKRKNINIKRYIYKYENDFR